MAGSAPTSADALQFGAGVPDLSRFRKDEIRVGGLLYMERFHLTATSRLHRILLSDPDRDLHDHPWDFTSVLLTGGYRETTEAGEVDYFAPCVLSRRAEMLHRLTLLDGPMWTYVETGPVRRRWGFQTARGWMHWKEYEFYARPAPEAS